jgi:hypothetical protein
MRAIIADDNALNRFLIEQLISEFNFDIYFAKDGLETLKVLQEEYLGETILFLDIEMPILNGIEVLQALSCNNPIYPSKIAIICNSSISKQKFIGMVERSSYNYFIEKPISKPLLFELINNCFKIFQDSIPNIK